MNIAFEQMAAAYDKHKHLKNAADELGMKWQTLYWHLQKNGYPVVGNKSRYGSYTDQFARKAENDFKKLVPSAIDMNCRKFQNKWDFEIYGVKVDIKASTLRKSGRGESKRYAFCIKKQETIADFIVAFGYKDSQISKCYLFPKEAIRFTTTISISENVSKWSDYEINPSDLEEFFENYRS